SSSSSPTPSLPEARPGRTSRLQRRLRPQPNPRFFVRPEAVSSSRPAASTTSRAAAVKDGRRFALPTPALLPGHALTAVSTTSSSGPSGTNQLPFNGCYVCAHECVVLIQHFKQRRLFRRHCERPVYARCASFAG